MKRANSRVTRNHRSLPPHSSSGRGRGGASSAVADAGRDNPAAPWCDTEQRVRRVCSFRGRQNRIVSTLRYVRSNPLGVVVGHFSKIVRTVTSAGFERVSRTSVDWTSSGRRRPQTVGRSELAARGIFLHRVREVRGIFRLAVIVNLRTGRFINFVRLRTDNVNDET